MKNVETRRELESYMKRIFLSVCFCLYSCASDRIYFATPNADPSVYYEYSLHDVLSNNIAGENAYKEAGQHNKYFHIVSEVYILHDKNQYIIFSDGEGNTKRIIDSRSFYREYDLERNVDYDPNKIYRVKYTLVWRFQSNSDIEIDSIDGLLTNSEYEQLERKRRDEDFQQKKQQEEFQKKTTVEAAYQTAINTPGIEAILQYIKTYKTYDYWDYFNDDAYAEIAMRIVNDRNIKFENLNMTGNPYAYGKDTIYFYRYNIGVRQWLEYGGILCYIDNHALVIENIPDVRTIREVITNAYLRYTRTGTLNFANGSREVIPIFDLIYSFD
jgi:hypothetical protein